MSSPVGTRVRSKVTGAVLVVLLGLGAYVWSQQPELSQPPTTDDDRDRVVQLYVRSTFGDVHVTAVGRSNERKQVLYFNDTTSPPWSREVVLLSRTEVVTFELWAWIITTDGRKYDVDCEIYENNDRKSDDRASTRRIVQRADVFCKHTSFPRK